MNKNTILNDLKGIFKENISENIDIHLEESLSKYITDSVNFIKVVVAIEILYDIEFTDSELDADNFNTIQNLVDFIYNKV